MQDLVQLCLFVYPYIPGPGWKPQPGVPTPNCQGDETSTSFLVSQGDSSLPPVLQSHENVLARNYKAARLRTWGQSLRVSVSPCGKLLPLRLFLRTQTGEVSDRPCRV